ncbi:MAG TPA: zinc-dependent metalloprotease family protein [Actinomycetota bacterium]|nr:zinc-dependent metalloprotease family protein [Actinomycetota bacterium]
MKRTSLVVAALLLLTAAPAGAAPLLDREPDCSQIPPEVQPSPALESTPVLPVEVRVMYGPGDRPVVKEHMAVTRGAFERIGIKLRVSYDEIDPPAWLVDPFDGPSNTDILDWMKSHYGGRRPKGTDLVSYMTRYWSGGFADCIGGVAHADRAFALGSIDYAIEGIVPSPTADEGVIAAHELGHLLGAHHHYSNCAEAVPSGAPRGDANPCTTMSPLATTASTTFGLLEKSYIRHYAESYARG